MGEIQQGNRRGRWVSYRTFPRARFRRDLPARRKGCGGGDLSGGESAWEERARAQPSEPGSRAKRGNGDSLSQARGMHFARVEPGPSGDLRPRQPNSVPQLRAFISGAGPTLMRATKHARCFRPVSRSHGPAPAVHPSPNHMVPQKDEMSWVNSTITLYMDRRVKNERMRSRYALFPIP